MNSYTGMAAPDNARQETLHYLEKACGEGCANSAVAWLQFGFNVMPIQGETKIPAIPWDPWLSSLSAQSINIHWQKHPTHQVGFIVGDSFIVFDADSNEAIKALVDLEETHNLAPNLLVKTKRGEHHFFRRDKAIRARTDSHSTEQHPDRIDVKTGRSLVVLPPSTNKVITRVTINVAADLLPVTQAFVDAVFVHNGRVAPSVGELVLPKPTPEAETQSIITLSDISAMLNVLDPDMGYEDWLRVLMAVYHESQGSQDGYRLVESWSAKGTKYGGSGDIRTKWQSFRNSRGNPVTIGTLRKMVSDAGHDWMTICSETADPFVIEGDAPECLPQTEWATSVEPKMKEVANALTRFSLRGSSDQIEALALKQEPLLGEIALLGQLTAFYAAPNTGKTLIVLSLLIAAIKAGAVNPEKVFYVNVDDTATGLLQKVRLAEDYGFHMLSEGYCDFTVGQFTQLIVEITASNQANQVVVILDTLKKFTDLMDKTRSSTFSKVLRRFALQGGTVIALAHTNKNPGRNGKLVYSGTTDIVDDWDCAYTLTPIPGDIDSLEKIVEFENIKRRGDVAPTAAYAYTQEKGTPYYEILLSVRQVDLNELTPIKVAESVRTDSELIDAVVQAIERGITTKMRLVDAVSECCTVSQRTALRIIEKYTGTDPALHRWKFSVKERGAKVFQLLEPTPTTQVQTS